MRLVSKVGFGADVAGVLGGRKLPHLFCDRDSERAKNGAWGSRRADVETVGLAGKI